MASGASCVRVSEWLAETRRNSELRKHGLVESSRLGRGAIVCFLGVRVGSNNWSSRLESEFVSELRAWEWAILEPGRQGLVVCFV